jgi:hypothetical protein
MLKRLTITSLLLTSVVAVAAPEEGMLPGIDFPAGDTTAKKDEWVLSVNTAMYERFAAAPDKEGVIFYAYKVKEPGPKSSTFGSASTTNTAPNLLVIPIPPGGKAKKGDILLTWWQSGSGMKRAIVMDAKDPKQPTVRYLDIDYDNPAKGGKDNATPIGQMEEQLKPDSFVKLDKPFQVGSTVACTDGKEQHVAVVVRASGDKLLLTGFVGHLAALPKASCKAMPYNPKLKVGQKVQAKWVNLVKPATVTKIDPKIGRVWVKFEGMGDKETALAYGHVIDKL